MDDGQFAGVEFIAKPEEPSDQGFDGIGSASRIFSRFYAAQTIEGDQVIQLHGVAAPDWFAPLANWDFKSSKLPLWLFHIQPPAADPSGDDLSASAASQSAGHVEEDQHG